MRIVWRGIVGVFIMSASGRGDMMVNGWKSWEFGTLLMAMMVVATRAGIQYWHYDSIYIRAQSLTLNTVEMLKHIATHFVFDICRPLKEGE